MPFFKVRLPAVPLLLLRRSSALALVIAATVVTLAHWLWLLFTVPHSPSVVLHYNIYFGIDRLGGWREIFILPLLSTALLAANLLAAIWLIRRDRWLAYGLLWAALVVACLLMLINVMVRWQFP